MTGALVSFPLWASIPPERLKSSIYGEHGRTAGKFDGEA
jgi:hypothetical protein